MQAIPVEVLTLAPTTVRDTSEYLGALQSRRSITVLPQVSGYITSISARPGQRVTSRQPLLRIDSREQQAALAQSEASLKQIIANRDLARRTRDRSEALFKEGLQSQQEYDRARAEAQAAEATVAAAEAQVNSRQVTLRYHDITAPFDGVVGDIPVKLGDYVTPQTRLTSVDQNEALEASVDVPLERAGQVRVGQTQVELLNDEGKVEVRAPVFFLAPQPNPQTQLVQLKAAFPNPARLRQGQFVRARVVFDEKEGLTVPTYAITRQSGQTFVFGLLPAEKGGPPKVVRKPVKLGPIQGNDFVLLGGMKAGEQVAVTQVQNLRDGMPVKPLPVSTPDGGSPAGKEAPAPPADAGQPGR